MKKVFLLFLVAIILTPSKVNSQNNNGVAVAVAGIAAIGSAIAINAQMKEMAELKATEWLLDAHPEFTSFSLKTLDFDAKKAKDASGVSVVTYKIQLFTPSDKPDLNGKKFVLFAYLSDGWVNQYGLDFSKFMWDLIDKEEWLNMMTAYSKVASAEKNETTIKDALIQGKVVNKGIKGKIDVPFYKLEGDMYVVTDYSDSMKLLYNERSLGIYLKKTRNLVQIGRGDIIEIHDYLLD